MKILIISAEGVKEFIPLIPNQENQAASDSVLTLLKENLTKDSKNTLSSETRLYTISMLETLFSTSRPTLYNWIGKGLLKPIKLVGRVYFRHEDIEKLLESNIDDTNI